MPQRLWLCLILWSSLGLAAAATSADLLGVNYSEWFTAPTQMATDASGALYLLAACPASSGSGSCVTKLSADGTTVLWMDVLGFQTNTLAVSPAGDVFVVPVRQPSDTSLYVAKLGAAGSGVAWKLAAGFVPPANLGFAAVLAADSQGRSYLAAPSGTTVVDNAGVAVTMVVRIDAAGSAIDYSVAITGQATAIAADGTGAVVVAGSGVQTCFVARLTANGSVAYYTSLPLNENPALALDASGNPVIWGGQGLLQRFNASGAVTLSTSVPVISPASIPVPTGSPASAPLAVDSAGNAYVLGVVQGLYPVQNSIAPCLPTTLVGTVAGTAPVLTVVAPDGSIPQITYVPGAEFDPSNGNPNLSTLLLALGPNSRVFVSTGPAPGFVPTRQGPFPQGAPPDGTILVQLSPQPAAPTLPLTCVVNAANYLLFPVAPGQIVSLMGSGLGPTQGIQTQATPQSPFPVEASGVRVTFDGIPAPLLWVQAAQINAIVPWELTAGTNTQICVLYGTGTNCLTWPVAQTAPGVFTVDGTHAAAVNQDGSLNSAANPAAPGSIVSVYATGLGPINPSLADGSLVGMPLPSNIVPVAVEAQWYSLNLPFGGLSFHSAPVTVTFAGPVASLVAGASQLNFQIPPANNTTIPATAGYALVLPSVPSISFSIYVAGQ